MSITQHVVCPPTVRQDDFIVDIVLLLCLPSLIGELGIDHDTREGLIAGVGSAPLIFRAADQIARTSAHKRITAAAVVSHPVCSHDWPASARS